MKKFENAEIEVIRFEEDDIIVASEECSWDCYTVCASHDCSNVCVGVKKS